MIKYLLNLFKKNKPQSKPLMVLHCEVEGKRDKNGKYYSIVTKTLMTMEESVALTVAKF